MSEDTIISIENVSKSYDKFRAVNSVSMKVQAGTCFGLLGPNGAGKSTLISMIYGAASRDSGKMDVLGFDPMTQPRDLKKQLGVVLQENALDEAMSVRENMLMFAKIANIPLVGRAKKVDELLSFMNLTHKSNAPIRSLSGGMQRRLTFVRALINNPKLLILDEPTTGLDPAVRHTIWQKILDLKSSGKSILLTTHYLDEAERLCDDLVIMNEGKIQARGTPEELIKKYSPGYMGMFAKTPENRLALAAVARNQSQFELIEESSAYGLRTASIESLTELCQLENIKLIMLRPCNLEDVFLSITGRELTGNA